MLRTNIARIIWQTVRRITNEIMGVKGLKEFLSWCFKHLILGQSKRQRAHSWKLFVVANLHHYSVVKTKLSC